MNTYSTPTITKEFLNNGHKIPIIIYEMNPFRDPNKRINHYRNIFHSESPSPFLNKTQTLLRKSKKKKKEKNSNNKYKLYNSLYQKLFLRINYERPQEIKNENGVIISRHFRTLDINSKEFPDQRIRSYYLTNKINSEKKLIFDDGGGNKYRSSFFSTEIKYPLNTNMKNYNSDKIKKYNSTSNNFFSKTSYNFHSSSNKILNNNNYNNKNLIGNKKFDAKGIPPLLIYKNQNSIKKLNNDIYNKKNLLKLHYEENKNN